MLTANDLHGYQVTCIEHMLQCDTPMLWVDMGLGKQQPNSEPVLTPDGWRPMGSLRPGDQVIGSNGAPCTVLAVFPQGESGVLRVTFSDGSWTRAGREHLWYVETPVQRKRGLRGYVRTTQQLLDAGLHDAAGNRRFHIPLVQPVQHPEAELPVEPYLLGVILGDGCIKPSGAVAITSDAGIVQAWPGRVEAHPSPGILTKHFGTAVLGPALRALGLTGKRSWEKHVPAEYLSASIAQRLALLQGLLDTDGSPITDGGVEFCSTAEPLVDAVIELTQSLGGVARNKSSRVTHHQNGEGRLSWRVNVKLPAVFDPFRLPRKLAVWVRPSKYPPARLIESIEADGREASTCILVDAPDHLYVTRNHIVTHNTVSTLTALVERKGQMRNWGTLIVAPLRVCQQVWRQEAQKWSHVKGRLTFSLLTGPKEERQRALFTRADVYLINYEGLPWLLSELEHRWLRHGLYLPFNAVIWDEVSKMKNTRMRQGVERGKSAIKILPYCHSAGGLTGTPASNGLLDLFGQYLVVDRGARLGTSFEAYQNRFFYQSDRNGYKYQLLPGGEQAVRDLIGDITISMAADDYLQLPPYVFNDVELELPPKHVKAYKQMEKEFLLAFESGKELEIFNEASLSNRCLQFANGACYTAPGSPHWEMLHDVKLEALADVIEEAAGKPVLVAYQFQHDAQRILKRFPFAVQIGAHIREAEFNTLCNRWNAGQIPLLIGHPASIGHGLNIQAGSNMAVWFGLTWSLDLYDQLNARLRRQGQTADRVLITRLLVKGTLDEAVRLALASKAASEGDMRAAVKQYMRMAA